MPSFRSFDGTDIEYTLRGEGSPLILVNGLACVESYWKYTIQHFMPHMQVITYDLRGHGKSGPPNVEDNIHIKDHARDLSGLITHLKLNKPVVAGFSLGVQIMFESYRQAGNNMSALVAVTGPYQNPGASFYGVGLPRVVMNGLFAGVKILNKPIAMVWKALFSSRIVYDLSKLSGASKCSREDIQGFYDHAKDMDVALFFRFAEGASLHSAEDVLPTIDIPVLIIGAEKDTFTPPSLSKHMARLIPGADYLHIKGATHTAIVEQPDLINQRIEKLLRERAAHVFEKPKVVS